MFVVRVAVNFGRNRVVRRLLASAGLPVFKLRRVQIGPFHLERAGAPVVARLAHENGRSTKAGPALEPEPSSGNEDPNPNPRPNHPNPDSAHLDFGLSEAGVACLLTDEQCSALRDAIYLGQQQTCHLRQSGTREP